jgi:hypothetical protein
VTARASQPLTVDLYVVAKVEAGADGYGAKHVLVLGLSRYATEDDGLRLLVTPEVFAATAVGTHLRAMPVVLDLGSLLVDAKVDGRPHVARWVCQGSCGQTFHGVAPKSFDGLALCPACTRSSPR